MEKYIIIFVILATIYYIQTKLKETEGFESLPAQSVGGVDDNNAINTLAQISKQLMVGGLTIPGNMSVQGTMQVQGDMTLKSNVTVQGTMTLNGDVKGILSIVDVSGPTKVSSSYAYQDATQKISSRREMDKIIIDPKKNEMSIINMNSAKIDSQIINTESINVGYSLKIGGATLTWDPIKNMLVLDTGLIINNGLVPGNKTPGLITNNIIFGPSNTGAANNVNDPKSLENLLTTPLKNSWIPDFSTLLGPGQNNAWWFQRWGATKVPNLGVTAIYSERDLIIYGGYAK